MESIVNIVNPGMLQTAQQLSRAQDSHSGVRTEQRVGEVAQEFESLFIEQMLKELNESVDFEDNILYGGHGEKMFRGMYTQELARSMAQAGGIGIATQVKQELLAHYNPASNMQSSLSVTR